MKRLVDMDRYCKINVDARRPEDVYPDARSLAVDNNVTFLRTCVREFPVLNLAHRDTGRIYARFERGRLAWKDQAAIDAIEDAVTLAAIMRLRELLVRAATLLVRAYSTRPSRDGVVGAALPRSDALAVTLGRWGPARS